MIEEEVIKEIKEEMNVPAKWGVTPDNEALIITPRLLYKSINLAIDKAEEKAFEEVYKKAKKLGSREIPDCATDWTDLMRWLEHHLSTFENKRGQTKIRNL